MQGRKEAREQREDMRRGRGGGEGLPKPTPCSEVSEEAEFNLGGGGEGGQQEQQLQSQPPPLLSLLSPLQVVEEPTKEWCGAE